MNEKKLVFSILMANYNNGRYIKEAIKSILAQIYNNWELIIVDDASVDNSLNVIQPYLKDKRIKLFKHKKNLGCGATKKNCARNAIGDIFGIVDSDDFLHKEAINEMIKKYKNNHDLGCVYSTFYECDKNLKVIRINPWVKMIENKKNNLIKSFSSHFLTFRKNVYIKTTGFDEEQKSAVDKDIIYKLEEVCKFAFINKPLYYYRIHDKNISLGRYEQEASAFGILAKYKAYKRRKKSNILNLQKKDMTNLLLLSVIKFFMSLNFVYTFKMIKNSFFLKPINLVGYKFVVKKIFQEIKHKLYLIKK